VSILDELTDEYDRAMALVNLLSDRATGGSPQPADFEALRRYALDQSTWAPLLPRWLRSSRSLGQFWSFIQGKFPTYRERTAFLHEEFSPLLDRLEAGEASPAADDIEAGLQAFSSDEVSRSWRSMTRRVGDDPEGAITASRNLLETVLKHILDDLGIVYDHDRIELPELYRCVQKELDLAPEQHQEPIFKQILGGCSGVVNGLGAVRNRLGDAHGKGSRRARPAPRHARLAVNLGGAMALFLTETHFAKRKT